MSARRYFVYELKKALFAICSIAIILTAITVTGISTYRFNEGDSFSWGYDRAESGIEVISFMVGVLAAVVPIWMLSYKMKKRSVDLYYALPLKRRQVLCVKYLLGLIAVYAPYTLAFFLGAIAAVIRFPSYAIAGEYYFAAYFASLPAIFCIYSISSFAFTRAERTIDGIVFVIFWMVAQCAVIGAIGRFVDKAAADMFMPTAPLSAVAEYFASCVEVQKAGIGYNNEYYINIAVGFSLTGLQAVAAAVMLFLTERKSKAENIGGVSSSPFGYKVMIPLLTICVFINIDIMLNVYEIFLAVIVASMAFMLTALYRHSFKIGKVQAIVFGGTIILAIALSLITGYVTAALI